MNNLVVINDYFASPWTERPLAEGLSARGRVAALAQALPDVTKVVYLTAAEQPHLQALADRLLALGQDFDHVFYLWGDLPLVRADLVQTQYQNHLKYRAEYSFADGFPVGLGVEILAKRALAPLAKLAQGQTAPVARDALFTLISRDINAFDIETELAPLDVRSLRLELATDTRRNFLLCQRLAGAAAGDLGAFLTGLKEAQAPQRTLPAYFPLQITPETGPLPNWSPQFAGHNLLKPETGAPWPAEAFVALIKKILDFAGDAVLAPGWLCEPALYPHWPEVLAATADLPGLRWVVETASLDWKPEVLDAWQKHCSDRVDWIILLDTNQADTYRRLRPQAPEGAHARVLAQIDDLLKRFPGHVHPQAVRQLDTEDEMEGFYRFWKDKAGTAIIQKYNHFSGRLPARKVVDLTPYQRPVCWHLKRDFPIRLDGSVVSCPDDVEQSFPCGNALAQDLEAIWEAGQSLYRSHLAGQWPGICGNCDEYYTFNF